MFCKFTTEIFYYIIRTATFPKPFLLPHFLSSSSMALKGFERKFPLKIARGISMNSFIIEYPGRLPLLPLSHVRKLLSFIRPLCDFNLTLRNWFMEVGNFTQFILFLFFFYLPTWNIWNWFVQCCAVDDSTVRRTKELLWRNEKLIFLRWIPRQPSARLTFI